MTQRELFADAIDFGAALVEPGGGACASPIGRRRQPRRRPHAVRPSRPTTAAMLGELRARLDALSRELGADRRRRDRDGERIELLLRKVTSLERAAGLVELHVTPRHTRRRPLG